jgi:hypothetical protein
LNVSAPRHRTRSPATESKNIELVRAKARDSVKTFLTEEYVADTIVSMEETAGKPVETSDQVKTITKKLAFTDSEIDGVLAHFIRGGQTTLGGVMQAVSAYAQTVPDADAAFDLEAKAVRVLDAV